MEVAVGLLSELDGPWKHCLEAKHCAGEWPEAARLSGHLCKQEPWPPALHAASEQPKERAQRLPRS